MDKIVDTKEADKMSEQFCNNRLMTNDEDRRLVNIAMRYAIREYKEKHHV